MGGRGARFEWSGIAGCFGLKSSWLELVFRIKEVLVMGWGSDRPVFSLGEQRMEKSLEDSHLSSISVRINKLAVY